MKTKFVIGEVNNFFMKFILRLKGSFWTVDLFVMKKYVVLFFLPFMALGQTALDVSKIEALIQQKKYEKAQNLIFDFIAGHPNDLQAIELLGDALSYQEKWDEAVTNYSKLVIADCNNADYQYKYGGALGMKALSINKLMALGLIGDIKRALIRAAELDPGHINARWALVEFYMQLPRIFGGSKSKSLHYADELEKLSKIDGYLAKGYIYEYDDEPKLAEKYYKMAINSGISVTGVDKLTNLYEKENQPVKAISNMEKAQKQYYRNALHYQIGKIAAEYNIELQKGEENLRAYIENYTAKDGVPKAWAHYRLAQIYSHKKNKHEALKYIDLALAELPKIKPFKEEREKILRL